MKMRKGLALLLSAALTLSLAGCGEGGSNAHAEKLTIWLWDTAQAEALQPVIAEWASKTHTEVAVSVKDKNNYWNELDKGVLPSVMMMDTEHLSIYVEKGDVRSLDEWMEQKDRGCYQGAEELFRMEGSTYALPSSCTVSALWYNKTLFDRASVAYPDDTWTWDTLYATAKQLTTRSASQFGIAIPPQEMADGWYNTLYSYGGSIFETDENGIVSSGWNSDGTISAMNYLGRLVIDTMPSQPTMEIFSSEQLFESRKTAMALLTYEEAQKVMEETGTDDWGCTVLPYCDRNGNGACDEGERAVILDGTGWAVSGKTPDGAAAFQLIQELSGEAGQKALAESGQVIPAYAGLEDTWCPKQETETAPAEQEETSKQEDAAGEEDNADAAAAEDSQDKAENGADAAGEQDTQTVQPDTTEQPLSFAPYAEMLKNGCLVPVPVQQSGMTWQEYALNNTLYYIWNNPTTVGAWLKKQDSYTQNELDGKKQEPAAADTDAAAAEAPAADTDAANTEAPAADTDAAGTETAADTGAANADAPAADANTAGNEAPADGAETGNDAQADNSEAAQG